jgi:deoxyhypusine synthase
LIENGFVDWIVSTGANLYHDLHFALGDSLHSARPDLDDTELRRNGIIRIYDILLASDALLSADAFVRSTVRAPIFQRGMGTAEFHYLLGRVVTELEDRPGTGRTGPRTSLLAAAWRAEVPIFTPSPGDSSIGMNIAAEALQGNRLTLDVAADVNASAALVFDAKQRGGKSGVMILGGGAPKNFLLQTEPHLQQVLGLPEAGHDYFLQLTDARPDTGGLSGATASEAVTWGKLDPTLLPQTVTCYVDSTIGLPVITAYAFRKRQPRPLKRLYTRLAGCVDRLSATVRAASN